MCKLQEQFIGNSQELPNCSELKCLKSLLIFSDFFRINIKPQINLELNNDIHKIYLWLYVGFVPRTHFFVRLGVGRTANTWRGWWYIWLFFGWYWTWHYLERYFLVYSTVTLFKNQKLFVQHNEKTKLNNTHLKYFSLWGWIQWFWAETYLQLYNYIFWVKSTKYSRMPPPSRFKY